MIVNDFLVDHFKNVVDYSFTAEVEKEFDDIAHGSKKWEEMIKSFYGNFHSQVEASADVQRADISAARELGVDPKTGKNVMSVSVQTDRCFPLPLSQTILNC